MGNLYQIDAEKEVGIRRTTAQRDAIVLPETGAEIFNLTTNQKEVNTGTPTSPVWSSASLNLNTLNRNFFVSGRYYNGSVHGMTNATILFTAAALRTAPFQVHENVTFDRISIEVTVISVGASVRLGIYKDNGFGYPGELVLDAGTVDAGVGFSGIQEISISQMLAPGLYWIASISNGTPTIRTSSYTESYSPLGFVSPASQANLGTYNYGFAYAALPNPHPVGAVIAAGIRGVCLRAV